MGVKRKSSFTNFVQRHFEWLKTKMTEWVGLDLTWDGVKDDIVDDFRKEFPNMVSYDDTELHSLLKPAFDQLLTLRQLQLLPRFWHTFHEISRLFDVIHDLKWKKTVESNHLRLFDLNILIDDVLRSLEGQFEEFRSELYQTRKFLEGVKRRYIKDSYPEKHLYTHDIRSSIDRLSEGIELFESCIRWISEKNAFSDRYIHESKHPVGYFSVMIDLILELQKRDGSELTFVIIGAGHVESIDSIVPRFLKDACAAGKRVKLLMIDPGFKLNASMVYGTGWRQVSSNHIRKDRMDAKFFSIPFPLDFDPGHPLNEALLEALEAAFPGEGDDRSFMILYYTVDGIPANSLVRLYQKNKTRCQHHLRFFHQFQSYPIIDYREGSIDPDDSQAFFARCAQLEAEGRSINADRLAEISSEFPDWTFKRHVDDFFVDELMGSEG